jgi:hypothetical protein
MRFATFVLGLSFALTGGAAEVADKRMLSNGHMPATLGASVDALSGGGREGNFAVGVMGLVSPQHGGSFSGLPLANSPQQSGYHPANVPLPETRTLEDYLLTAFVALMLIAYQLRRKHRFLRPHQFIT